MKINEDMLDDGTLYIKKEADKIPYIKQDGYLCNVTGTICAIESKDKILDMFNNISSVNKLDTDKITENSTFFDWLNNRYPELVELESELACLYNVSADSIASDSDIDNWYLVSADDKDWELLLAHYNGKVNSWFLIAPNVEDDK
jgi:hypothetical protein